MIPALITITLTFAATVILMTYIGVKAIRQAYQDGCIEGAEDAENALMNLTLMHIDEDEEGVRVH